MLPGKFMWQGQKTDTAFSLAPQASRLQASEKLYESEKRKELIQTTDMVQSSKKTVCSRARAHD
jgi:hypothetical protein